MKKPKETWVSSPNPNDMKELLASFTITATESYRLPFLFRWITSRIENHKDGEEMLDRLAEHLAAHRPGLNSICLHLARLNKATYRIQQAIKNKSPASEIAQLEEERDQLALQVRQTLTKAANNV